MRMIYMFWLILIIELCISFNLFSQDISIINKEKKILEKNTKFRHPIYIYQNKYLKIKIDVQILSDSIKMFEIIENFVVRNYCINILNENKEIIHMQNYGRAHKVYFGEEDLLDIDKLYEEKVKKELEKSLSYEKSLVKYKKKYIKIKVPIRQRQWRSNNISYDGYGLEHGKKYYITMSYTNEDKTYHSDTIPLHVW